MQENRPTTTSTYSSAQLSWRIGRYLLLRGVVGVFRLVRWLLVWSLQVTLGLLRLIASPASSGRAQDEFQDLVRVDSPENRAARSNSSDDFWRMYLQAYTPRAWRMRRLFTTIGGRRPKPPKDDDE